ncbi:unnamed protein product [Allacma fusca]|uniref:Uncharacterized protein n=1 Tax=Allacma fusca TaxID=39272 RepID=A0A8J2NTQ1_9HEXA|nr:unnamed protein product [Allacma fusca]
MYILKATQILLVVVAAGVNCDEIYQLRPSSSNMCYSEIASVLDEKSQRYQHTMVDATGQKCYKTISDSQVFTTVTKGGLDKLSVNASAEVCPGWSNSKKCLFNHLDTKCNSTEVERFQEDFIFNYFLTSTELLCEPSENFNFLNFLKDGGFSACISTHQREIRKCVMRFIKGNNGIFAVAFHETIPVFHQCYIQPIKTCSQGNTTKELRLLGQSIQLEQARLASYDAFANDYVKFVFPETSFTEIALRERVRQAV